MQGPIADRRTEWPKDSRDRFRIVGTEWPKDVRDQLRIVGTEWSKDSRERLRIVGTEWPKDSRDRLLIIEPNGLWIVGTDYGSQGRNGLRIVGTECGSQGPNGLRIVGTECGSQGPNGLRMQGPNGLRIFSQVLQKYSSSSLKGVPTISCKIFLLLLFSERRILKKFSFYSLKEEEYFLFLQFVQKKNYFI